jgi:tagatose 1,6-diphosphate aldolase
MTHRLTPGRWRRLKATSAGVGTFRILAFDQRGNYRAMLPPEADFATASRIKSDVVGALAPWVSAVLLDPQYGVEAAAVLPGSCGLLLAIEKTGYAGAPTAREIEFIPGWDVDAIQHAGASAVKLLAYYHPDSPKAEFIEHTIRTLAESCRAHEMPLFVEPLSYSLDADVPVTSPAFAADRPRIVTETARRLSRTGADVLKLEFPIDVKHVPDAEAWRRPCEAVSEASAVPWTLLSAGVDFDTFARQVTVACRAGASGFVGGRAIWREAIGMTNGDRIRFLHEEGRRRVETLAGIVEAHAMPWTRWYAPPYVRENGFAEADTE